MSFTPAQLIANARSASDKVGDLAYDDSADFLPWINAAVESLYKKMVGLNPDLYLSTSNSFTLAGGSSAFTTDVTTLTPQFRSLLGVDVNPNTSSRRPVRRRNFMQRNQGANNGFWFLNGPWCMSVEYVLIGNKLQFLPYENAAGTYVIYYRQAPYLFTGTSDTNTLDPQLEPYAEWVWLQAARMAMGREDSNYAFIDERLLEINAEIEEASERDSAYSAVIADDEFNDRGYGGW